MQSTPRTGLVACCDGPQLPMGTTFTVFVPNANSAVLRHGFCHWREHGRPFRECWANFRVRHQVVATPDGERNRLVPCARVLPQVWLHLQVCDTPSRFTFALGISSPQILFSHPRPVCSSSTSAPQSAYCRYNRTAFSWYRKRLVWCFVALAITSRLKYCECRKMH